MDFRRGEEEDGDEDQADSDCTLIYTNLQTKMERERGHTCYCDVIMDSVIDW